MSQVPLGHQYAQQNPISLRCLWGEFAEIFPSRSRLARLAFKTHPNISQRRDVRHTRTQYIAKQKRFEKPPNTRWFVVCIQVVPGRAGGGSFRRKKKDIAKKEFPYRMCARRPTHAQTISLLWTSFLLFHGGNVTCFDVMKLLAGWDEVLWFVVRWRGVSYCG